MTVEAPKSERPMTEKEQKKAIEEGRIFRIGDSYLLAAQIPDDSVGCSGSRCSNCNSDTAYCKDICGQCELPFVGPFGFPQLPSWKKMSVEKRIKKVEEVYGSENHGRLGCVNAMLTPLNPREWKEFETGDWDKKQMFFYVHNLSWQKLGQILHS